MENFSYKILYDEELLFDVIFLEGKVSITETYCESQGNSLNF